MEYIISVTPQESVAIQEACFKKGIYWRSDSNEVKFLNMPFLIINLNAMDITYDDTIDSIGDYKLISVQDMLNILNDKHCKKVYCIDCRHCILERWGYKKIALCDHPYNTKVVRTYYSIEIVTNKERAKHLNANNNCEWYEEVVI